MYWLGPSSTISSIVALPGQRELRLGANSVPVSDLPSRMARPSGVVVAAPFTAPHPFRMLEPQHRSSDDRSATGTRRHQRTGGRANHARHAPHRPLQPPDLPCLLATRAKTPRRWCSWESCWACSCSDSRSGSSGSRTTTMPTPSRRFDHECENDRKARASRSRLLAGGRPWRDRRCLSRGRVCQRKSRSPVIGKSISGLRVLTFFPGTRRNDHWFDRAVPLCL